jgi:hypothetical protein
MLLLKDCKNCVLPLFAKSTKIRKLQHKVELSHQQNYNTKFVYKVKNQLNTSKIKTILGQLNLGNHYMKI